MALEVVMSSEGSGDVMAEALEGRGVGGVTAPGGDGGRTAFGGVLTPLLHHHGLPVMSSAW